MLWGALVALWRRPRSGLERTETRKIRCFCCLRHEKHRKIQCSELWQAWVCSRDAVGALWERFVAEALKHGILRGLERPGLQKPGVLRVFCKNIVFYMLWSVQKR